MSLFDTFSIAQSGLAAAQTQLNVSANNIANANSSDFQPSRVDSYSVAGGGVETSIQQVAGPVDLPSQLTDSMQAGFMYDANAIVIRTADQMLGSLLDIFDNGSSGNRA